MALLYDSRFRALDSSGNPLVAATLTVKNAGTNTLSSIYRDNALGTPMSNPTSGADISDSGGWFPQIFLAEGALFDITLKNAAGVTVQTYLNVTSLGAATTTFTRDFGNSRARIAGSGGIVRYEAGDPSGDDSGGQVVLGGYSGTQADTASIDAAATNTTGTLTVNSLKLPGTVSSAGSVAASATLIVALPNTPSGVCSYDIDLVNVVAASVSSFIYLTVSYDSGVTYESTNYVGYINGTTNGNTDRGVLNTSAGLQNVPLSAKIHVTTNESTSRKSLIWGVAMHGGQDTTTFSVTHSKAAAPQRITHVKFFASAGNITGKYRVIPAFGSGDA